MASVGHNESRHFTLAYPYLSGIFWKVPWSHNLDNITWLCVSHYEYHWTCTQYQTQFDPSGHVENCLGVLNDKIVIRTWQRDSKWAFRLIRNRSHSLEIAGLWFVFQMMFFFLNVAHFFVLFFVSNLSSYQSVDQLKIVMDLKPKPKL